jgi:hypothetical protein
MTYNRTSRNNRAFEWFGDGSGGDVTISSSVSLSADTYYDNLTIVAGAALSPSGYRVFVANVLDLSSAPSASIVANGGSGSAAAGATQGGAATASVAGSLAAGQRGTDGHAGSTTNGDTTTVPAALTSMSGGNGGESGYGGDFVALGRAGGHPTALNSTIAAGMRYPVMHPLFYTATPTCGAGGAGGCSGAGDGTASGGGGGGGNGGNFLFIGARVIARGTNANTAIIQAKGGAGGDGGVPAGGDRGGGGGGAGGGGGCVVIACEVLAGDIIDDAIDVGGGDGGDGGAGTGAGTTGSGGGSGARGVVVFVRPNPSGLSYLAEGTRTAAVEGDAAGRAGQAGLVDL